MERTSPSQRLYYEQLKIGGNSGSYRFIGFEFRSKPSGCNFKIKEKKKNLFYTLINVVTFTLPSALPNKQAFDEFVQSTVVMCWFRDWLPNFNTGSPSNTR